MNFTDANTGRDYLTAAAVLVAGLLLAKYIRGLVNRIIDSSFPPSLAPEPNRDLRRAAGIFGFLIALQGLSFAQGRLAFVEEFSGLAARFGMGLTIASQLLFLVLLLSLLSTSKKIRSAEGKNARDLQDGDEGMASMTRAGDLGLEGRDPDFQLIVTIVRLFLKIQVRYLDAPPDSPVKFSLVEQHAQKSKYTFELQVNDGGTWKSRRMSIGRIGAESGSRSKCFYVIFDDYLVVKVPPVPITGIEEYLDSLKKESALARMLAMEECIVPSVSAVLRHIDRSSERLGSAAILEERARKSLLLIPKLQRYLKVGDTFAYFMNLSEYYFLQDVVESIHDTRQLIADEILGQARSNWSSFGRGNLPAGVEKLLDAVRRLCEIYESGIIKAISSMPAGQSVAPPQRKLIRNWFALRLAGEVSIDQQKVLPARLRSRILRSTDEFVKRHQTTVDSYRRMVERSVEGVAFLRNQAAIEGVISNLLDLLAVVGRKRVALRDLKPDNLLVAGDRRDYPGFLAKPTEYKIGLIDIETGVFWGRDSNNRVEQAQLGGTPQYATPAHFFCNELLEELYPDLGEILHLQDWQGMIGVIYKVITGRFIFEKTARLVPVIVNRVNESLQGGEDLAATAISLSRSFWEQAGDEFYEKLAANRRLLDELRVVFPERARAMFQQRLIREDGRLTVRIRECIEGQPAYATEKGRRTLLLAPASEVGKLLTKWKRITPERADLFKHRGPMLDALFDLEKLKKTKEQWGRMLALLERPAPGVSALMLLESMFQLVVTQMSPAAWQAGADQAPEVSGDLLTEATMAVDEATMVAEAQEFQTIMAAD